MTQEFLHGVGRGLARGQNDIGLDHKDVVRIGIAVAQRFTGFDWVTVADQQTGAKDLTREALEELANEERE